MEDLALSICKVYNDQSKKGHEANTLFQLNSFIYTKFYKDQVPKVKKKLADEIVTTLIRIKEMGNQLSKIKKMLDDELVTTINQIEEIRNQFIAHLDNNHGHYSIPIKDITKVLYALRDMLNGLCIKEIDARVEPLDDDTLSSMHNDIVTGTELMLNGGSWPVASSQTNPR